MILWRPRDSLEVHTPDTDPHQLQMMAIWLQQAKEDIQEQMLTVRGKNSSMRARQSIWRRPVPQKLSSTVFASAASFFSVAACGHTIEMDAIHQSFTDACMGVCL